MSDTSAKKQGTPNWADCATTDLSAAVAFYAAVFGWASERVTGSDGSVYSVQRLGGKRVAGIYELSAEMRQMGVPPHWGTYFEVEDVDAMLGRVRGAGGTVVDGPLEEPEVGRIAVIQDCVGGFLRLWRSAPQQGAELFNSPGAMCWNELCTDAPDKAAAFYEHLFGVEVETMTEPTAYTILKLNGHPVAGILKMTPEMGEVPPSWDVYFASSDVDATVASALAAGGTAIKEPFDVAGGMARMAVLRDPLGAVFEVIKMEVAES